MSRFLSVASFQKVISTVLSVSIAFGGGISPVFISQARAQEANQIPVDGSTVVTKTANGKTDAIFIATPDGNGVSHNRYQKFNISKDGAALVNFNDGKHQSRSSALGGRVISNIHLAPGSSASLIINEVVSQRQSELNGFMEVVGPRTQIVVANPNGITCDGCGFLNTSRATLSTGTPQYDGQGKFSGLSVKDGKITVNRGGLNAENVDILDLVSRSLFIDGKIDAKKLGITAGSADFHYNDRTSTAKAGSGAEPRIAIDSTYFGGAQAGSISIIAHDNNVGVRMDGSMNANADDIQISANGDVNFGADISAKGRVDLSAKGSVTIEDRRPAFTSGKQFVYSETAVTIKSETDIKLGNNLIGSAGDVLIASVSGLSDAGDAESQRYAASNLTVVVENGAARITGGASYNGGAGLNLAADSLEFSNSATTLSSASGSVNLLADSGDLQLGGIGIQAANALNISANTGQIAAGTGSRFKTQSGNINLEGRTVDLAGSIVALGAEVLVFADDLVSNTGSIIAKKGIILTVSGADFNNTGRLLTDGNVLLSVLGALNNDGIVSASGKFGIKATTVVNNSEISGASGNIVSADIRNLGKGFIATGNGDLSLSIDRLTNENFISSGRDFFLRRLTESGSDTTLTIADGTIIQASGQLNVLAANDGSGFDAVIARGGLLKTNGLNTSGLNNLTVSGKAQIGGNISGIASGDFRVTQFGQFIATSTSAGTRTLGFEGNANIEGLVTSIGEFAMKASNITVEADSAVTGFANLSLEATTGTSAQNGRIVNRGFIYSDNNLDLIAKNSVKNTGAGCISGNGCIRAKGDLKIGGSSGEILLGVSSLSIGSGQSVVGTTNLVNRGGIESTEGDVLIVAKSIVNDIPTTDGQALRKNTATERISQTYYEENSGYSGRYTRSSGRRGLVKYDVYAFHNSGSTAYKDYEIKTRFTESYENFDPTGYTQPQILASNNGGSLSILGFDSLKNTGGQLSADTINLIGNDGAELVNEATTLETWVRTEQGRERWRCDGGDAFCISGLFDPDLQDRRDRYEVSDSPRQELPGTLRAGIFGKTNLNVNTEKISVIGSTTSRGTLATRVTGVNPNSRDQTVGFQGITITSFGDRAKGLIQSVSVPLPINRYGLFVLATSPTSEYVYEANPLYTSEFSPSLPSNYLALKIGLDIEELGRKLGSSQYEAEYVRQQALQKNLFGLVSGYGSNIDLLAQLFDNAVEVADDLDLEIGVSLSQQQVAALKEPIVWEVFERLPSGEVVRVAKLFVPDGYSENDSLIASGGDANIQVASLENTGGSVRAENLNIDASGDVSLEAGTLEGGNVNLATGGNLAVETRIGRIGVGSDYDDVTSDAAAITSTGNLNLRVGNDLKLAGGSISAGGNADIDVDGETELSALVLEKREFEYKESGDITFSHSTETKDRKTQRAVGSTIKIGGDLDLSSEGDVTLTGSEIATEGAASVESRMGSVTVQTQELLEEKNWEKTDRGFFAETDEDAKQRVWQIAVDDFSRSVEDLPEKQRVAAINEFVERNRKKYITGKEDYAASVTIGYRSSSHSEKTTKLTHARSGISAGQGVALKAKDRIELAGADIKSGEGNDIKLAAADIDIQARYDDVQKSSKREETSIGVTFKTNVDDAGASVGFVHAKSKTDEVAKTAGVSSLNSGGNIIVDTSGKLSNEGTSIAAAGKISVKAGEIDNKAAVNEETYSHSEESTSISFGYGVTNNGLGSSILAAKNFGKNKDKAQGTPDLAGKTGRQARNEVQQGTEEDPQLSINLSPPEAQFKLSVSHNKSEQKSRSTKSIVTHFTSGGDIELEADGSIRDEGTKYTSGDSISVTAEDYQNVAAVDTKRNSSSSSNTNVTATLGLDATGDVNANISAQHGTKSKESRSTKAAVGGLNAKNDINLNIKSDVVLEGTNLAAGEDVRIDAGGDIELKQANDTSYEITSSERANANIGVSVSTDLTGGGVNLSANYRKASLEERSSDGVAGSIKSGGNLVLNSGKGDIRLEGTNLEAGENVELAADQGSVDFAALESSHTAKGKVDGGGADLSVYGSSKGARVNVGVRVERSRTDMELVNRQGGAIKAGGGLKIKAADTAHLIGTQVDVDSADIEAESLTIESAQSTVKDNSEKFRLDSAVGVTAMKGNYGGNFHVGVEDKHSKRDNITNQNAVIATRNGTNLDIRNDATLAGASIKGGTSGNIGGKLTVESRVDQIKEDIKDNTTFVGLATPTTGKKGKGDKASEGSTTLLGSGLFVKHSSEKKDNLVLAEKSGFDGPLDLNVSGDASLASAKVDKSGLNVGGDITETTVETRKNETSSSTEIRATIQSALGYDGINKVSDGINSPVKRSAFKKLSKSGSKSSSPNATRLASADIRKTPSAPEPDNSPDTVQANANAGQETRSVTEGRKAPSASELNDSAKTLRPIQEERKIPSASKPDSTTGTRAGPSGETVPERVQIATKEPVPDTPKTASEIRKDVIGSGVSKNSEVATVVSLSDEKDLAAGSSDLALASNKLAIENSDQLQVIDGSEIAKGGKIADLRPSNGNFIITGHGDKDNPGKLAPSALSESGDPGQVAKKFVNFLDDNKISREGVRNVDIVACGFGSCSEGQKKFTDTLREAGISATVTAPKKTVGVARDQAGNLGLAQGDGLIAGQGRDADMFVPIDKIAKSGLASVSGDAKNVQVTNSRDQKKSFTVAELTPNAGVAEGPVDVLATYPATRKGTRNPTSGPSLETSNRSQALADDSQSAGQNPARSQSRSGMQTADGDGSPLSAQDVLQKYKPIPYGVSAAYRALPFANQRNYYSPMSDWSAKSVAKQLGSGAWNAIKTVGQAAIETPFRHLAKINELGAWATSIPNFVKKNTDGQPVTRPINSHDPLVTRARSDVDNHLDDLNGFLFCGHCRVRHLSPELKTNRRILDAWYDQIGLPTGDSNQDKQVREDGIRTFLEGMRPGQSVQTSLDEMVRNRNAVAGNARSEENPNGLPIHYQYKPNNEDKSGSSEAQYNGTLTDAFTTTDTYNQTSKNNDTLIDAFTTTDAYNQTSKNNDTLIDAFTTTDAYNRTTGLDATTQSSSSDSPLWSSSVWAGMSAEGKGEDTKAVTIHKNDDGKFEFTLNSNSITRGEFSPLLYGGVDSATYKDVFSAGIGGFAGLPLSPTYNRRYTYSSSSLSSDDVLRRMNAVRDGELNWALFKNRKLTEQHGLMFHPWAGIWPYVNVKFADFTKINFNYGAGLFPGIYSQFEKYREQTTEISGNQITISPQEWKSRGNINLMPGNYFAGTKTNGSQHPEVSYYGMHWQEIGQYYAFYNSERDNDFVRSAINRNPDEIKFSVPAGFNRGSSYTALRPFEEIDQSLDRRVGRNLDDISHYVPQEKRLELNSRLGHYINSILGPDHTGWERGEVEFESTLRPKQDTKDLAESMSIIDGILDHEQYNDFLYRIIKNEKPENIAKKFDISIKAKFRRKLSDGYLNAAVPFLTNQSKTTVGYGFVSPELYSNNELRRSDASSFYPAEDGSAAERSMANILPVVPEGLETAQPNVSSQPGPNRRNIATIELGGFDSSDSDDEVQSRPTQAGRATLQLGGIGSRHGQRQVFGNQIYLPGAETRESSDHSSSRGSRVNPAFEPDVPSGSRRPSLRLQRPTVSITQEQQKAYEAQGAKPKGYVTNTGAQSTPPRTSARSSQVRGDSHLVTIEAEVHTEPKSRTSDAQRPVSTGDAVMEMEDTAGQSRSQSILNDKTETTKF